MDSDMAGTHLKGNGTVEWVGFTIKTETSVDFFETGVSCRSFRFESRVSGRSTFLREKDSLWMAGSINIFIADQPDRNSRNDSVKFQWNQPQPS
jgi:hypothetical protein